MVMSVAYAYFQSNSEYPEFMPLWNSVFLLQPNPDDVYYYAPLDAKRTYRIVGTRGTMHMVNFLFGHDMIGISIHRLEAPVTSMTRIFPLPPMAAHPAAHTNQCTRSTLAHPVMLPGMGDGFPLGAGRYHFLMPDPSTPHCRAWPRPAAS
jgi:hypothetical protein